MGDVPPSPGDAVRVEMTKWGERPHWAFDATYLGSDEHGDWIGIPTGTPMARPGASFVTETDQAGLVPAPGPDLARGWLATFHAPGYHVTTYVDMTTPPVWDGPVVRAVDLDLDVILSASGDVLVDDEDEFEEHQRLFDYPAEVVELARHSCDLVHDAVLHQREPFGSAARTWLTRVGGISGR